VSDASVTQHAMNMRRYYIVICDLIGSTFLHVTS